MVVTFHSYWVGLQLFSLWQPYLTLSARHLHGNHVSESDSHMKTAVSHNQKKKKRITELLLLYLYPLFHLSYDLLENPECLSSYRPLKMNLSEKFSSPSQIQEFLHLSVINTCKIQNPSFLGWACCDSYPWIVVIITKDYYQENTQKRFNVQ